MATQEPARIRGGKRKVWLCDYIVELGGGHTYVCGRHTKNRNGRCSQHQEGRVKDGR